jgi:hypothetical protein
MLIKETIQQENITILNIYALNTRAPHFHKTNTSELKGTDRTRYSNCGIPQHHTLQWRISRPKKIKKDILELTNTMYEMNLTDICRVFHPMTADYTFFSIDHGTFSKNSEVDLNLAKHLENT